MIHELLLNSIPFELIKNKKKNIEMRLYDERRKNIKIGDIINFTNRDNNEQLKVKVINLYRFNNFEELYNYFPKEKLGYSVDEEANPKDMEIYYSIDKINEYGVIGIEISLIEGH